MKKVHIAMVGKDTENIVHGVIQVGGSELYTIVSEKFQDTSIDRIRAGLPSVKLQRHIGERELVINPFNDDSFFHIVGLIVDIANSMRQRKDVELWINITGGTNLMSAAAATGAMLTESKAYYVLEQVGVSPTSIIELPYMMNSQKVLENDTRKKLIQELSDGERLTNDDLVQRLDVNKKSISKHLKILESLGLVIREPDGRKVFNELTDIGKLAILLHVGGL